VCWSVKCICVCVYKCTEQLPPGSYPVAVKYIIPYRASKLTIRNTSCSNQVMENCKAISFFSWGNRGGWHVYVNVVTLPHKLLNIYHDATSSSGPRPSHYQGFMITLRHTTLDRIPLDEWSARRKDFYLTTHNRHTSMPPAGFEPKIPASERPQTYDLDRAAIGIGQAINFV